MATYCYYDSEGNIFESNQYGLPLQRAYRAEAVGFNNPIKQEREWRGNPQDFLPQPEDFRRKAIMALAANDLRANEGKVPEKRRPEQDIRREADRQVREWNATHEPQKKAGNKLRPKTSTGTY